MKKKWFTILFSAICALACALFFGCDSADFNESETGGSGFIDGVNSDGLSDSSDSSDGDSDTDSSSKDVYGPMYAITYETTEYLANVRGCNPEEEKAGERVTIVTHILMDADLVVYVNGEKIEQIPYDAAGWGYTFVMPDEEVYIEFDVVGTIYLWEFETWLTKIPVEDIVMLKETNEIAGIAPGNFKTHYAVTDSESIAQLFSRYQSLGMEHCKDDCYVPGGLSRTVTFMLEYGSEYGEEYKISFYQGLYVPNSFSSLSHYHVIDMPSVADYPSHAESYSIITATESCGIYTVKAEETKWGTYEYVPDVQVGEGEFLGGLNFIEYHGAVPENEPNYCIIGEYFGDRAGIYVIDSRLFFITLGNGYGDTIRVYYEVLNYFDLYMLIEQFLWTDVTEFTDKEKQLMLDYLGFELPFLKGRAYAFNDYTDTHSEYFDAYVSYEINDCTMGDIERLKAFCEEAFTFIESYGVDNEFDVVWHYHYLKDEVKISLSYWESSYKPGYSISLVATIRTE